MGQRMFKAYRRAARQVMNRKQREFFEATMSGLFALSRGKRLMVALQLVFGRKKWVKGN